MRIHSGQKEETERQRRIVFNAHQSFCIFLCFVVLFRSILLLRGRDEERERVIDRRLQFNLCSQDHHHNLFIFMEMFSVVQSSSATAVFSAIAHTHSHTNMHAARARVSDVALAACIISFLFCFIFHFFFFFLFSSLSKIVLFETIRRRFVVSRRVISIFFHSFIFCRSFLPLTFFAILFVLNCLSIC